MKRDGSLLAEFLAAAAALATLVIPACAHAQSATGPITPPPEAAASATASAPVASAPTSTTPAAKVPAERRRFAIVIGNNRSLGRRRPELHYADDDAARYYAILQTLAPGRVTLLADFDRDTAGLFPDAKAQALRPSRTNLEAAGRRVAEEVRAAQRAGQETELYLVFAGHGDVEHGEGFIEMSDARFRSSDLEGFLRSIPFSRAHVILDSCNSFFMLGVRKPGGRHFATSEDATRALASRLQNVGVFLSTSAEGEAFEWSEIQSGIFSHVVRSGLLGAADANSDGSVSYLELAAFVDTATAGVRNPNMRPHVFARGPGARNDVPIAALQSMTGVRRLALDDGPSLRIRLRDAHGLPLLNAYTEPGARLRLALPEAWARGATLERTSDAFKAVATRTLYAVPDVETPVTLATLEALTPRSAVRGPDEAFQALFAEPFGPNALAAYQALYDKRPPPVYGVSQEDVARMDLVLDQLAKSARGERLSGAIGSIAFGALAAGGGIALLDVDPSQSSEQKTQDRILGGVLLGLGGLMTVGGAFSLVVPSESESVATEFRRTVEFGGDPAQAFAAADKHLQELVKKRRAERYAGIFAGALIFVGSATALLVSEVTADDDYDATASRLGWSAGMLGGGMIFASSILDQTPVDSLTTIWRDDPSLHQYQPAPSPKIHPGISLLKDGAFFSVSGRL